MPSERDGPEQRTHAQHAVANQRGSSESSHAEAHHELTVHEGGDANRARQQPEEQRKLAAQPILLLKDLLRHRQVADESAEHESARQRVAERNRTSKRLDTATSYRLQREGHSPFARQRFRLSQTEPKRIDRCDDQESHKDRAPATNEQHRLTD